MCKSCSHALPSRRRSAASSSSTSAPRRRHTASSSSSSSRSSCSSLAAARASLPSPRRLYSFQELAAATNGFLSKRESSYWRCSLRGRDAALIQLRAAPGLTPAEASAALARTARYHHASIAPLLGACLAGPHVYLAYRLPPVAVSLADCLLRCSPRASLLVVGTWLSRVQIAADVAQGLEYVHTHAKAAHGRISLSTVLLVSESNASGLRATLTHFGANQFAQREPLASASDVCAFGVLLLQLLSGEVQPSRCRFDRATKEFTRVSLLDTAAEALRTGRVRAWVDSRLGDSFPVAAAERLLQVGLRCTSPERPPPEMSWVAGKVSRVYVESRAWEHLLQQPDHAFSLSLPPR